jgi:hypothetical protein
MRETLEQSRKLEVDHEGFRVRARRAIELLRKLEAQAWTKESRTSSTPPCASSARLPHGLHALAAGPRREARFLAVLRTLPRACLQGVEGHAPRAGLARSRLPDERREPAEAGVPGCHSMEPSSSARSRPTTRTARSTGRTFRKKASTASPATGSPTDPSPRRATFPTRPAAAARRSNPQRDLLRRLPQPEPSRRRRMEAVEVR